MADAVATNNGADLGLERGEIGAGLLRAFDAEGSPNASL
jgi:hypothetical protein